MKKIITIFGLLIHLTFSNIFNCQSVEVIDIPDNYEYYNGSIIILENDTIFVNTVRGIIAKDLSNPESDWLTYALPDKAIYHMAKKDNVIYVVTSDSTEDIKNLYLTKSEDYGKSWETLELGIYFLYQSPINKNLLVSFNNVGMMSVSTDFGTTWGPKKMYNNRTASAGINPGNPDNILNRADDPFMMENYYFCTINGGESWFFEVYTRQYSYSMSYYFFPNSDKVLICAPEYPSLISYNNGISWEDYSYFDDKPDKLFLMMIGNDSENNNIFYLLARTLKEYILYKSYDLGETWEEIRIMQDTNRFGYVYNSIYYKEKFYLLENSNILIIDVNKSGITDWADKGNASLCVLNNTISATGNTDNIRIYTCSGICIKETNSNSVSIADLDNGTYIAISKTKDGRTRSLKFQR